MANTLNLHRNGAVGFIDWLGCKRGNRMDVIWRLLHANNLWNGIRIGAAVNLDVIEIAARISKENDL